MPMTGWIGDYLCLLWVSKNAKFSADRRRAGFRVREKSIVFFHIPGNMVLVADMLHFVGIDASAYHPGLSTAGGRVWSANLTN